MTLLGAQLKAGVCNRSGRAVDIVQQASVRRLLIIHSQFMATYQC